jgi:hypothetical protein
MPGQKATPQGEQVLGNCGQNGRQWHWTGRGAGSTTVPPGEPIALRLPGGPIKLRLYAREGPGTAAMNPRLDLLYLTDDLYEVPTDKLAAQLLGKGPNR